MEEEPCFLQAVGSYICAGFCGSLWSLAAIPYISRPDTTYGAGRDAEVVEDVYE